MMRTLRTLLVVAASVPACRSPADCVAAPTALLGIWDYSATQTTPGPATLDGSLSLEAGCPSFQGSLDGTQWDQGISLPVHLLVTGQMLGTTSLTFDASFGASGRRHIGTIANDSIRGTWVDQAAGRTGLFVAAKEAVP